MRHLYEEKRPLWELTGAQHRAKDSGDKKTFATVNTSLSTVAKSYSAYQHLLVVSPVDGSLQDVHVIKGKQAHYTHDLSLRARVSS